eukprot:tig00020830_g14522.t1
MLRSLYADLNVAIRLARPIDWETDDPVLPDWTLTATAAVDKEAESLLVRTPYQPIYEGAAAAQTAAPPTAPQQARPRRNAGQAVGRAAAGRVTSGAAGTAVATAEATVTVAATAAVARRNPHNPLSTRTTHAAYKRHENDARLRGCPPTLRELFDMVWKAQYAECQTRSRLRVVLGPRRRATIGWQPPTGGRNERQQPFLEGPEGQSEADQSTPEQPRASVAAPRASAATTFNPQADVQQGPPAVCARAIMDRYGISMRKTGYKAPPRPTRACSRVSADSGVRPAERARAAAIIYPEA